MVELQKIAGAALFALILIVGINVGGDALEHLLSPAPVRHAEPLAAARPPAPATAPAPQAQPASADRAAVKKCIACHSFEQGGANRIGPNLFGVVGRDIASAPGFSYSGALKALPGAWTPDTLDAFVTDPKAVAPGNKMGFAGESDAQARAAIIAYLTSLK